jgi:hypothetical protein
MGIDPCIGQRRAVDCVRSPSSREQWSCSTLSMTRERWPRTETANRKRTSGVHGLAWEAYVLCWLGFPCRVYNVSNRRDPQI